MTDQKQYNELAARLQRLETLIQNNDAYQPPGAVTLEEMDLGPGMDFSVPTLDQWHQTNLQWDPAWDPSAYSDWQTQQMEANQGFNAESQATIDDMLSRMNAIETFLSGGSNDTNQSGALNWGSETGDDGQTGTGDAGGIPAGYAPLAIEVCDGTTLTTINVIAQV